MAPKTVVKAPAAPVRKLAPVAKPLPKAPPAPAPKKAPTAPKAAAAPVKAAKAPKEPKAKAEKPAKDPALNYRKMRKYTVPKLTELIASPEVVFNRLGKAAEKTLSAATLVEYLTLTEADMPDWAAKKVPNADGTPKRRGRPPKDASKVAAPPAKTNTKATFAKIKSGAALPPKAPQGAAPAAPAAPKKFSFKKAA